MALCLWVAVGLVYGAGSDGRCRRPVRGRWLPLAAGLGLAMLLAVNLTALAGRVAADRGAHLLEAGDPQGGAQALRWAATLNPFDAGTQMQLAQAVQNANPVGAGAEARRRAETAVALSPHDVRLRVAYAAVAVGMGDVPLATRQLEEALESCPLGEELYGELARLRTLTELRQTCPQDLPPRCLMPERPPLLTLCLGEIACMEGEWVEAEDRLRFAAGCVEGKSGAEALSWLAVALQKQGRGAEAREVLRKAAEAAPDVDRMVLEALQLVTSYRRARGEGREK